MVTSPLVMPQVPFPSSDLSVVLSDQDMSSPEPVMGPLLTHQEILVENHLNSKCSTPSLFDLFNEYSNGNNPNDQMSSNNISIKQEFSDQNLRTAPQNMNFYPTFNTPIQPDTHIPVITMDSFQCLRETMSYSAPPPIQPAYQTCNPPTPPQASPPPPLTHYDPIIEVRRSPEPIICSSPIRNPVKVSCNTCTATLYPNLLCRGSRGRCILYNGEWLTPNQYEYRAGRERSKYWKRSLYIEGKSLLTLIKEGKLHEHQRACTCQDSENLER